MRPILAFDLEIARVAESLFLRMVAVVLGTIVVAGWGWCASALAEGCSNGALRSGPSASLPDCRAYEQVSPVQKGGWPVNLARLVGNGEHVIADSLGLFAGATGSKGDPQQPYLLSRGETGWETKPLNDAPAGVFAYSGGFGEPALFNEAGESLSFLRPAMSSIYENDIFRHKSDGFVEVGQRLPASAIPAGPVNEREQNAVGAEFIATTPDLSHVLFTIEPLDEGLPPGAVSPLWPGDTTFLQAAGNSRSLYEYSGVGNLAPELVGLDDSGRLISDCGTYPGGAEGIETGVRGEHHNAISADGSTVFFTARECGGGPSGPFVNELFARVGGSYTVALSEPEALSPAPANDGCTSVECVEHTSLVNEATDFRAANFDGASADGARVFFTSAQQLLNGATQDPSNGSNLYEYDFEKPEGERLGLVSGGESSGLGPGVQGVGMVSEDGSHVYFVARGVLTTEPRGGVAGSCLAELDAAQRVEEAGTKEGLCRPKKGAENLYARDTSTGVTAFVGTLSESDAGQWRADGREAIDVTGDGRFAVFTSLAHLTSDDTAVVAQVFRYDADSGTLVRVSIGAEGFNHNGNVSAGETTIARGEGQETGFEEIAFDLHPAVSDGGVVVFTSSVALVNGALSNVCFRVEFGNCNEDAQNVYEYENGQVHLISYGGPTTGMFEGSAAISTSGTDIYFQSTEQLAVQDTDTLPDIYDARAGGGFPAAAPAVTCSGGCKSEAAVVPQALVPGSAAFSGPGDPVAGPTPIGGIVKKKSATEVRAEALKSALKACRKTHGSRAGERKVCEALAHRRFAPRNKKTSKKSPQGRK